jgi:hypothetical protein
MGLRPRRSLRFCMPFVLPIDLGCAIANGRCAHFAFPRGRYLPMARVPPLRFHLSTAIVLLLVAGVLLGLNMRSDPCGWFYGFPYTAVSTAVLDGEVSAAYADQYLFDSGEQDYGPMPWSVQVPGTTFELIVWPLLLDVLLAVVVLVVTAVGLEWRIGRRHRGQSGQRELPRPVRLAL